MRWVSIHSPLLAPRVGKRSPTRQGRTGVNMESLGPMQQKPARIRILDAAHELMLTIGLARATTKEIAKAAGCSEAALYKYFPSKEELFVSVLKERLPQLTPLLAGLAAEPGGDTLL